MSGIKIPGVKVWPQRSGRGMVLLRKAPDQNKLGTDRMTSNPKHPGAEKEDKPAPAGSTRDPQAEESGEEEQPRPDPTRYGDWEKGGRCIDF